MCGLIHVKIASPCKMLSKSSFSEAIFWNFQCVKCIKIHMEQDHKKAVVEGQNPNKGFEKNQHGCSAEGVFVVSGFSARPYLKVAGPYWRIQS